MYALFWSIHGRLKSRYFMDVTYLQILCEMPNKICIFLRFLTGTVRNQNCKVLKNYNVELKSHHKSPLLFLFSKATEGKNYWRAKNHCCLYMQSASTLTFTFLCMYSAVRVKDSVFSRSVAPRRRTERQSDNRLLIVSMGAEHVVHCRVEWAWPGGGVSATGGEGCWPLIRHGRRRGGRIGRRRKSPGLGAKATSLQRKKYQLKGKKERRAFYELWNRLTFSWRKYF